MRTSYDWEDMQPNRHRDETFAAIGSVRLPYDTLKNEADAVPSLVVDVYKEDKVRRTDNGAQASFYSNGACTECPDEFAIKTFSTFHEAYCAYNRQLMASLEDMAPPVGRMVLFSHLKDGGRVTLSKLDLGNREERKYVWGYQTAVAEMNGDRDDTEMRWDAAQEAFQEHIDERRYEIDIPSCFDQDVELEPCENYEQSWKEEYVQNNFSDSDHLKDQIESHCWAHDYEQLPTECELMHAVGLSDFEIQHGDRMVTVERVVTWKNQTWNPLWGVALVEAMRRSPEPNQVQECHSVLNGEPTGDLHNQNFGEWNGDGVIIDWGFHILGGGNNHPTSTDTCEIPDLRWDYKRQYAEAVCVREA